jgi:hypothetical protein
MRIDPDHCTDPVLLAAEVRRLRAVIASGDCPADNAAQRDKAPPEDATPDECTVRPSGQTMAKMTVSVPQAHEKPYAKRILFDTFGATI